MTIRVNVEPTNPGQFFACCGLLELADRLWPGAEGWFENGEFHVQPEGQLSEVLNALVAAEPQPLSRVCDTVEVPPLIAPLRLPLPGSSVPLDLDGWMTVRVEKGEAKAVANPPWNFWSGQQTSLRIWQALQAALAQQLNTLVEGNWPALFSQLVVLTGRFGFDPGPAWNTLDVGFSPNEQGLGVASSAAVELLAAVGLQRFRPRMHRRDRFVYVTWGVPLGPAVAAAAMAGCVPAPPSIQYLGRVISRGSYAALGYSTPLSGDAHDSI